MKTSCAVYVKHIVQFACVGWHSEQQYFIGAPEVIQNRPVSVVHDTMGFKTGEEAHSS